MIGALRQKRCHSSVNTGTRCSPCLASHYRYTGATYNIRRRQTCQLRHDTTLTVLSGLSDPPAAVLSRWQRELYGSLRIAARPVRSVRAIIRLVGRSAGPSSAFLHACRLSAEAVLRVERAGLVTDPPPPPEEWLYPAVSRWQQRWQHPRRSAQRAICHDQCHNLR